MDAEVKGAAAWQPSLASICLGLLVIGWFVAIQSMDHGGTAADFGHWKTFGLPAPAFFEETYVVWMHYLPEERGRAGSADEFRWARHTYSTSFWSGQILNYGFVFSLLAMIWLADLAIRYRRMTLRGMFALMFCVAATMATLQIGYQQEEALSDQVFAQVLRRHGER